MNKRKNSDFIIVAMPESKVNDIIMHKPNFVEKRICNLQNADMGTKANIMSVAAVYPLTK